MRRQLKVVLKYLLAIFLVAAGLNHFIDPAIYLKIMPPYLPWHLSLVYLSGFLEIAFGILLLIPRFAVVSAWGIILLLIAVYPANIQMALHPHLFPEYTPLALWARLPLQALLIAWAYWYTRDLPGWPRASSNPWRAT